MRLIKRSLKEIIATSVIFGFSLMIMLAIVALKEPNTPVAETFRHVDELTHNGHRYLVLSLTRKDIHDIVHDPDCPKCNPK